MSMEPSTFSKRLLDWHRQHGRHDLPWQVNRTPYRVWLSEIMLQQTQVSTVIPYFLRFTEHFPNIEQLAHAEQDAVLHLWTGLGYYARARNLHKAAQLICEQYQGHFPTRYEDVLALPGIGRSTAGAILAQSMDQRHAILDGNVKRVLSRFFAIAGWPGKRDVENLLWEHAERLTPTTEVANYTQAIMDLGATLCTRSAKSCGQCPVRTDCTAYRENTVGEYPSPRPKKTLPVRSSVMLLLRNHDNHVMLKKRPPTGIWGGLWSFPEADCKIDAKTIHKWCTDKLSFEIDSLCTGTPLRHTFSHFHLDITPVYARAINPGQQVMEHTDTVWYNTLEPDARGLAAPVQKLLDTHNEIIAGETL